MSLSSTGSVTAYRTGLVAVCLLALYVGGFQITNESYVSLQGDMPRHMMNGVFVADLLKDRPFSSVDSILEYTNLYFARYPALSLGHHPPLLAAVEAPFFLVFGPSVWAARTVVLLSLLAAVVFLYRLVADRYGALAGGLACTLFVTSSMIVELSQSVMSEVMAIALLLAAAYSLERYWQSESRLALVGLVAAATLSLYAKQLAVFAFPAFVLFSISAVGWRRLLRRDVLVATCTIVVLSIPLALVTIALSPSNVTFAAAQLARPRATAVAVIRTALIGQLSVPVVILAVTGMLLAVARRDRRAVLFGSWIASVLVGLYLAGHFRPARYAVYWVPAMSAMTASLITGWRRSWVRWLAVAAVVVVTAVQLRTVVTPILAGAAGYEDAARFVLTSNPGPTVLFSGDVDTGYFTFFVRKHDPGRRLVVLRADKLLTTSYLWTMDVKNNIADPSEIYPLLQRFGTRYVVIEDRQSRAPVLEWLRQELRTPKFVERQRIAIGSRDFRVRGTSLAIYEYLEATPADPDAPLMMEMPLANRSLDVRMSDLIDRKYLR